MVDWQPLRGAIPPLKAAQWQHAFAQYQNFPEFAQLNAAMTLAEFKFIFWMEYAHRLLGRCIGLAFLAPFLYFWGRGMLPPTAVGKLGGVFLLGAAQGLLGWYMVKSGLGDEPRVSHYRLAAHFALAVAIYAYLLRLAVEFRAAAQGNVSSGIAGAAIDGGTIDGKHGGEHAVFTAPDASRWPGAIALFAILLTMLSGALVAGSHAGHIHNTWPAMSGQWIPAHLLAMRPWWINFIDNAVAIQFTHRALAPLTLLAVGYFAYSLWRHGPAGGAHHHRAPGQYGARALGIAMLATACAQTALGIATLLLGVPAALGVAHQATAMALLTLVVLAMAARMPLFARSA